ncbi:hypothetical protein ACIDI_135c00010 [Acidiphilium sp. JA12-A1]|nr:hypothetical protein ACIDI_135c00010 [Acidiphilium sp. JA12-A1]
MPCTGVVTLTQKMFPVPHDRTILTLQR